MKFVFTEPFKQDYERLPQRAQRALDRALSLFEANPRHPSLHAKKLPGTAIWYARISRAHRFTFQYEEGRIVLRRAGTHPVLNRERKTNR